MKRRTESPPAGTRRPSAPADGSRGRIRDERSRPRAPGRSEKTLPGDRGAREQESTSQGSE